MPGQLRRCDGVYPRERGGTVSNYINASAAYGLSPRTRGNQRDHRPGLVLHGSIPANAGEPSSSRWARTPRRVYPRERGGTADAQGKSITEMGLSPRTRGNRWPGTPPAVRLGSIPANAGEPQCFDERTLPVGVYPRERGGTSHDRRLGCFL